MTEKTLPTVEEAMGLVAEDAAKANHDERHYSLEMHEKSRQGDVYFTVLNNDEIPAHIADFDKKPVEKMEIAKSHKLNGHFRVKETTEGTFFVRPANGKRAFTLNHPEHPDHIFNIPKGATLYFWIQKTMTKNTVGRRVWD